MGINEPDLMSKAPNHVHNDIIYIYICSVGKRNNAEASGCNILALYGKTLPIYQSCHLENIEQRKPSPKNIRCGSRA